jgi:hypothetical protein
MDVQLGSHLVELKELKTETELLDVYKPAGIVCIVERS